jgi:hypothetical protein
MSGPEQLRQGLAIIPRQVSYSSSSSKLLRTTEIWLVDEGDGASGPSVVREQGLVIAFGFDNKPAVDDLHLTVCIRDHWQQPCQDWVKLDDTAQEAKDFAKLLTELLDQGPWKWKAWKLAPSAITVPEPAHPQCEAILVEYEVHGFKPKKQRGFHVVPIAVSALGVPASKQHYVLGLAVYTQHNMQGGAVNVEDFVTVTYPTVAPFRPTVLLPQAPVCSGEPCARPVDESVRQSPVGRQYRV